MKIIFLLIVLLTFLISCSSGPKQLPEKKEETTTVVQSKDTITSTQQKDSVPLVYLDDADFNTVAKWYYKKYEIDTTDGSITGLYNGDDYEGEYWDEELIEMRPFFTANYEENGITKTALLYSGAYFYMHGHTHVLVDVIFFGEENGKWRFLDTIQFQEADISLVEESNISKKGFSIRVTGEWANMGAVSASESYYVFQNETLVFTETFWTHSGRFSEEEPYDLVTEGSAKVVIKENPNSDWNTIYYYATNYGCSQKDVEDRLSYCSSKWVYANGAYKIYPLSKKEKPK